MTLFYSKQSGDIKRYCTGMQDMNFFSSDKGDYELIYGFIVMDKDQRVLDNVSLFYVDNNKDLKLKQSDLSEYM